MKQGNEEDEGERVFEEELAETISSLRSITITQASVSNPFVVKFEGFWATKNILAAEKAMERAYRSVRSAQIRATKAKEKEEQNVT